MKNKLSNISSNNGRFTDGNPATGTLGTVVTAQWLNDVQLVVQDWFEEAKNVLALAGFTPNSSKTNQLAEAIGRYVSQKVDVKVGLAGNETISGEKTFNNKLLAFNGLRISYTSALAGQGHYAEMNADANTWWTSFKGHTLRYHADGSLSSDNNKFLMTKLLGTEDLNTVKVIGVYGQAATANATLARHYPVTEAGSLSVTPSAYGVMQIYTTYSTKQIYIRNQTASGWDSNWKRIDGADWSEIRNIPIGSTSSQGLVQSSDSVSSNSSSSVATSKAVKTAYDKGQAALELAGRKQSPATTLSGYGIADAVKLQDMRERNGSITLDDASPAQLPYGTFVGLSAKATLQNQAANGWKFISKGWGDASGVYACVRFGVFDNRFYFQTARDYNNWHSPLELAIKNDVVQNADMVGQVAYFATSTAPSGWIKANGAAISRTTYANLFARIGTTFGSGDGRTTFNLPDLRGEFIRGWSDGRNVDSGRSFGSSQGDAIRNITGTIPTASWALTPTGVFARKNTGEQDGDGSGRQGWLMDFDASRVVPTANENRPRNIALLACIKY